MKKNIAVVIATPAATHYRIAKEALLHRKDVFVEKPLSLTIEEGAELAELAEKKGLILMVGHILNYHSKLRLPRSALFKEAIELCLAVREKEEIRKRYMAVYANSSVRGKQLKRVEEMLPLALELWPEY